MATKAQIRSPGYLILLILLFGSGVAVAADLHIQLPRPEWMLEFISPPLTERESLLRPGEQPLADKLWPMLDQEKYQEAIQLIEAEIPGLQELLKSDINFDSYRLIRSEEERLREVKGRDAKPDDPLKQVSPALIHVIGQVYLLTEDYEKAEILLKVAVIKLPDFIRAHQTLALLYLLTEKYELAREHIVLAASLGGANPALFSYLGYLSYQTGNPWGEVSAYQQALAMEFDNRQYQQGLLHGLVSARQYDSASTLIDTLLADNQNDKDLWLFKAHVALEMGQESTALTGLEVAIRLGDESYAHKQICARLHFQQGSIGRGVELLESGFVDGLEFIYIDQSLAWLTRAGQWSYAEQLLQAGKQKWATLNDIEKSSLLTHEAEISNQRQRKADAVKALQQAVSLDPGNAYALINLADIYAQDKRGVEAGILYERASAYDNFKERALISHARLAIDRSDYPAALALLRKAFSHNPQRYDLRENIKILEDLVTTGLNSGM